MAKKTNNTLVLLRDEKARLEQRSEDLIASLEDKLSYTRENLRDVVGFSAAEAVYPSLPGFLQKIVLNYYARSEEPQPAKNNCSRVQAVTVAEQLLDFLPFIVKGKKGVIASFLLKRIGAFIASP